MRYKRSQTCLHSGPHNMILGQGRSYSPPYFNILHIMYVLAEAVSLPKMVIDTQHNLRNPGDGTSSLQKL